MTLYVGEFSQEKAYPWGSSFVSPSSVLGTRVAHKALQGEDAINKIASLTALFFAGCLRLKRDKDKLQTATL